LSSAHRGTCIHKAENRTATDGVTCTIKMAINIAIQAIASFTYDSDGNRIMNLRNLKHGNIYGYTNGLIAVEKGTKRSEYVYDDSERI
jgi:hypothetical protein